MDSIPVNLVQTIFDKFEDRRQVASEFLQVLPKAAGSNRRQFTSSRPSSMRSTQLTPQVHVHARPVQLTRSNVRSRSFSSSREAFQFTLRLTPFTPIPTFPRISFGAYLRTAEILALPTIHCNYENLSCDSRTIRSFYSINHSYQTKEILRWLF